MPNPFKNQTIKLKRTVKLAQILAKYGFQDLLSKRPQEHNEEDASAQQNETTVYERIRLAIEDLGPTFVKFGQTLSTREDLPPVELIIEVTQR